MSTSTTESLDLHDIALLLNYERASTEPRFRNVKLTEIAVGNDDAPFSTLQDFKAPGWNHGTHFKGMLFVRDGPADEDAPADTPFNMLPSPVPKSLQNLKSDELETIYWQARGHDACYKSIALLQFFMDQYSKSQQLRIRTTAGKEFVSVPSQCVIMEWQLSSPQVSTLAAVRELPHTVPTSYVSGYGEVLLHAVFGMAEIGGENVSAILDLSSMQFGELGRGLKSKDMFALESLDQFYDRLEKISRGWGETKTSFRLGPTPQDIWLKEVAKRVKSRWENRSEIPWCGHCGAPLRQANPKKCSLCKEVFYCNDQHGKMAYPFHKKFCTGKKAN